MKKLTEMVSWVWEWQPLEEVATVFFWVVALGGIVTLLADLGGRWTFPICLVLITVFGTARARRYVDDYLAARRESKGSKYP